MWRNSLIAVVVAVACWAACSDPPPSSPDPIPSPSPTPTATPSPEPSSSPRAPEPTPAAPLPLWVQCSNATGVCVFGTDRPRPVDAKCTIPGENDAAFGVWDAWVNDGDTVTARQICNKVEGRDCAPVSVKVQVDFHGMGRHIGQMGPTITAPQKLPPERCQKCVEEGPSERVLEPVWDQEILEGKCEQEVPPLPTASCWRCEKKCHQLGEQTVVVDYTCEDDQSRTRALCRNVKCPS